MEGCAVADAGGYGDDGAGDESGDDGGQGPFHAGDADDDMGVSEGGEVSGESVEAGDADVSDTDGGLGHGLAGELSLVGDGVVRGAGGDDGDDRQGGVGIGRRAQNDAGAWRGEIDVGEVLGQGMLEGSEVIGIAAGEQDVGMPGEESLGDGEDLGGCFAFREDDLGCSAAGGAVVVERGVGPGEGLERGELGLGLVGGDDAGGELLEDVTHGPGVSGRGDGGARRDAGVMRLGVVGIRAWGAFRFGVGR